MNDTNIVVKNTGNSTLQILLKGDGNSKFRTLVSNGELGIMLDRLLKGAKLHGIYDMDADRDEDVDFIVRLAKDNLYSGTQEIQTATALRDIRDRLTPLSKQYYADVFKRTLGTVSNNQVQFIHDLNAIVGVDKNKINNGNMHEGGKRTRIQKQNQKKQKRKGSRKSTTKKLNRKTRRSYY